MIAVTVQARIQRSIRNERFAAYSRSMAIFCGRSLST